MKDLLIKEQEREYENAQEEWLQRRTEEERDGRAEQLSILERQSRELETDNARSDD